MHGFNRKRTWSVVAVSSLVVLLLSLILPSMVLAEPNGPPSPLTPASPAAAAVADLHNLVLVIAVGVFVVVEGLIVFAAFRFRRRPKDTSEPEQIHGNTRLEIAWTIAPALIVITLFVLTLRTQATIDASAQASGEPLKVEVVGHQWWWEFRYPDLGVTTSGDLVIPTGRLVNLEITSIDVIHSFWVPELNGKTDAVPGTLNRSWLQTDQPGVYYGQCAELCGVSHGYMRFVVRAVSPDEFATWASAQTADAPAPADEKAQAGLDLFMTKGCAGCHTIQGIAIAVGRIGPNLTHVSSRMYIAGGILANTEYNQRKWLANPPGLKPGALMPNLNLSPDELDALAAYLQTLK